MLSKIENAPNTLVFEKNNKTIYLVGTAHVSSDSVKEVQTVIEQTKPDTVCIELCDSRYQSIREKDRWKKLDITQVLKKKQGFLLFSNMLLSSFQKRAGMDLESAPGEEMIKAADLAEQANIPIVLADRDVNVTLRRAWRKAKFFGKLRILSMLFDSLLGSSDEITEDDIDELLEGSNLFNDSMNLFSKKLPKVKEVLIDERDQFLAHKIQNAKGSVIVAVVGKGHQQGIIKTIETNPKYQSEIESVPPQGMIGKILPWLISAGILALFVAGFFMKGKQTALNMALAWVIANGIFTSVGALLALAHPVTILAAWIVSPITSLNPTIGAGLVLGVIEATLRKPRVQDFEHLPIDIMSFKGFFKNRITRTLLVFVLTSIGSAIGTFWGISWISTLLGK